MTYPNPAVIEYLNKNFIPVRFNVQAHTDIVRKNRILWAPTILILDSNGIEYYRFNGFLPPDEFIPHLEFGLAKMALEKQDIKTANRQFRMVVDTYPKSDIAPEAQYWFGVTEFQITHDVCSEVNAWRKITEDYPNSIWAKKVSGALSSCKEE
ncbi:MAG: thioredoxin family protein [wastewater metagenome]|nr:thioredoxin family protein [Candidatus Loosdrechtia aerotolerans]